MNRHAVLPAAIVFVLLTPLSRAYGLDDWPTHYTFGDGTDIGLTAVYRYDIDEFSDDRRPEARRRCGLLRHLLLRVRKER
jgi:phosphate-selective porin OprO/OprP